MLAAKISAISCISASGMVAEKCILIPTSQRVGTLATAFFVHGRLGSDTPRLSALLGSRTGSTVKRFSGTGFRKKSAKKLREFSRAEIQRCQYRLMPRKHKYALVRGRNRGETRQLMKRFAELNPDLIGLPYPKERTLKLQMPHEQQSAIAPCSGTQVSL